MNPGLTCGQIVVFGTHAKKTRAFSDVVVVVFALGLEHSGFAGGRNCVVASNCNRKNRLT
jgi:hypothetical protein